MLSITWWACGARSSRLLVPVSTPTRSPQPARRPISRSWRSEEHTSELQSLMRISYAVFCLKKKKQTTHEQKSTNSDHIYTHKNRKLVTHYARRTNETNN